MKVWTLAAAGALALARLWRDGQGAERTLGFAAVNALSRHLLDQAGTVPPTATDSIGGLVPTAGERIGMVGFFPPLVRQIADTGARLTVVELRADLAGAHPGFAVTLDPAALQDTLHFPDDLAGIFHRAQHQCADHGIDGLCRQVEFPGADRPQFAVQRVFAGCLPQPLFDRGITALGGTWVEDGPALAAALRSGAPWSGFARKVLWQRS